MLSPGKIYINRPTRLKAQFTVDGSVVDPTGVTLSTMSPSAVQADYTYAASQVIRSSAGNFYCDVTPDEPGRWWYRWVSTGTDTADVIEGDFVVQYSAFYPDNGWPSWDYSIR